jgi:hypothetical protein
MDIETNDKFVTFDPQIALVELVNKGFYRRKCILINGKKCPDYSSQRSMDNSFFCALCRLSRQDQIVLGGADIEIKMARPRLTQVVVGGFIFQHSNGVITLGNRDTLEKVKPYTKADAARAWVTPEQSDKNLLDCNLT